MLKRFLKKLAHYSIFQFLTLGTCKYARKMLDLLDPEGLYFANSQVITREDIRSKPLKKGLDLVWAHERVVLVVDDIKEVWKDDNAKNVIKIVPYEFFDDPRIRNLGHEIGQMKVRSTENSLGF
uniref:protein-serine/threonine phosphatase n=1 Tax=Chenopodium quinoa TaxID=63459 RepID=A0A803LM30_CHEQI